MNGFIDITIRGIDEELYRQIAALAATRKETVGTVINEAMHTYLTETSTSALEAEYRNILDKIQEIDGMALAGAPGATILMQEYKERLQQIKDKLRGRKIEEEEKESTNKISMIDEVKLTKSDLEQLGRIIIENGEKVRLEEDVDQEALKDRIERISRVQTLEIPKELYPLILLKVRDCQAIVKY